MTAPWWGGALSATQAEGAAPGSDWAGWEEAGRVPRSGDGNGFATRAAEDLALLAAHGLHRVRLSLDWSRLEPAEGRIAPEEVERWLARLDAAASAGVEVWLGLHHVATPGWFLDEGGFLDDRARGRLWPRFVERCAEAFGDRVAGWFPFDQPWQWAEAGYRLGVRPPGRRSEEATSDATRATALAWREAWAVLRGGPPVATSLDLPLLRVADETVTARAEVRFLERSTWGLWVAALRDGVLDVPGRAVEEVPGLRDAADVVGVTYRGPLAIDGERQRRGWPSDAPRTATGDTAWPAGLGEVLRRLAEELPGRRLLVARVAIGTPEDSLRAELLRGLDEELVAAAADGVPVEGALYGSVIDAYEWEYGFSVPFGLFDRDRNPRPSVEALS